MQHTGLEWGAQGVRRLSQSSRVVVIIDVLSFSTCVDVAVSRGALVYPRPARDEAARELAASVGGLLAARRRDGGYSLSPASLLDIPAGTRLVLPSPNGATLSLLSGSTPVLAGCLRNAAAVAAAAAELAGEDGVVSLIPGGERWPDGSLRPALEDWLGVGAVAAHLAGEKSPEVLAAEAAFRRFEHALPETLERIPSGVELIEKGFPEDVSLAAELNTSRCAPFLSGPAYVQYKHQPGASG